MQWAIESLLRVFAILLPKLHWLLTPQLVEECVPQPQPPNAVVFNCVDLGFHSVIDYLDFTLTHFVGPPVWRHSRFAALDMSNATIYTRHHLCNINYFLFPLLMATGSVMYILSCRVATRHYPSDNMALHINPVPRRHYRAPRLLLRTAGAA
jgi:hypothetical protein